MTKIRYSKAKGYEYDIREIPGYERSYAITNDGRVYSHISHKYLKARSKSPHFYPYVGLSKDGKVTTYKVHRLMGIVFLGITKHLQINHIDGDRTNNLLSNLEVVTQYENLRHAVKLGLIKSGSNHKNSKLIPKDIEEINFMFEDGVSVSDLAEMFYVHSSTIYRALGYKRVDRLYKYE